MRSCPIIGAQFGSEARAGPLDQCFRRIGWTKGDREARERPCLWSLKEGCAGKGHWELWRRYWGQNVPTGCGLGQEISSVGKVETFPARARQVRPILVYSGAADIRLAADGNPTFPALVHTLPEGKVGRWEACGHILTPASSPELQVPPPSTAFLQIP